MPHRNSRYVLDPLKTPIESRIASFVDEPSDEQLGIAIGYPMPGSSGTQIKTTENGFEVAPEKIPVRIATIWMYFVLSLMVVTSLYTVQPDQLKIVLFMCGLAAVIIIPSMMAIFAYCNRTIGDTPYLVLEAESQTISLPRLNLSFESKDVVKLIWVRSDSCASWCIERRVSS